MMTFRQFLLVAAAMLALCQLAQSEAAKKPHCFECGDDDKDGNDAYSLCVDPFSRNESLKQECKTEDTQCIKVVHKAGITRGCGHGLTVGCKDDSEALKRKGKVCVCDDDNCNSSHHLIGSVLLALCGSVISVVALSTKSL